jgi:hypothetical protein
MDDYYEDDYDFPCPACNNPFTRWQHCNECDDGFIDLYDEDPLWYDPGDSEPCRECSGTGMLCWCPDCGWDVTYGPVPPAPTAAPPATVVSRDERQTTED